MNESNLNVIPADLEIDELTPANKIELVYKKRQKEYVFTTEIISLREKVREYVAKRICTDGVRFIAIKPVTAENLQTLLEEGESKQWYLDKLLGFNELEHVFIKTVIDGEPISFNCYDMFYFKSPGVGLFYVFASNCTGAPENRRDSYRLTVNEKVRCKDEQGHAFEAILRDVSVSGASILVKKEDYYTEAGHRIGITYVRGSRKMMFSINVVRTEDRDDSLILGGTLNKESRSIISSFMLKRQTRHR